MYYCTCFLRVFFQLNQLLFQGDIFHLSFGFLHPQSHPAMTLFRAVPPSDLTAPFLQGSVKTFHDVGGSQTGPQIRMDAQMMERSRLFQTPDGLYIPIIG